MTLRGVLREPDRARELAVLVHGLGGAPDSFYCTEGAGLLAQAGVSSLCLGLRGADRGGDDFYNIALTADLHAAFGSPELAAYERLYLIGYSMGGYVSLHYATDPDPRLAGMAALCTPLDLKASQECVDRTRSWPYRHHVLGGLIEIYSHVAAKRPVPTPLEEVRRVRTIHEWDRLTIAPRYGFDSPEHYYEALSVVPHLGALKVPALHVAAHGDPVIPRATIEPFVPSGGPLELRWVERSGHLTFPRGVLGDPAAPGIEIELLNWMRARA